VTLLASHALSAQPHVGTQRWLPHVTPPTSPELAHHEHRRTLRLLVKVHARQRRQPVEQHGEARNLDQRHQPRIAVPSGDRVRRQANAIVNPAEKQMSRPNTLAPPPVSRLSPAQRIAEAEMGVKPSMKAANACEIAIRP